jgi:hypothetical protein
MTDRSADLALARVHLRLGSLALARAEFETLAGRDELDDAGLVDLAEVRWRTGDVAGAGEVATAILGEGDDGPLIVLVVAAEAALARGRPTEARGYSTRAMDQAAGRIDELFAGMPRGPIWPADATTLRLPAPTLFDVPAAPSMTPPAAVSARASVEDLAAFEIEPDAPEPAEPDTIELWDAVETEPPVESDPGEAAPADPGTPLVADPDVPAGADALRAGEDALAVGDVLGAAAQLALALRLSSALAPAVLDAIEGRPDRELAFVRGDAYRLVGRESEARLAFAEAVQPIDGPVEPGPTDTPTDATDPGNHHDPYDHHDPNDHRSEGDPA